MSTLSELQSIGDDEFETLITWYLRRHDPELAGLIVTGINEDHKPIACPVDGVLFIPGDPPQCVVVNTTTFSRNKLRGKWLGTENDAGDLDKAVQELERWREEIGPKVECTLYLATNRLLKSNVKLYRDAIAEGYARNVKVKIVEASLLEDFLDHNPEGQYLRQELLGIEADHLSEILLRKIGGLSLDLHRHQFAMQWGPPRIEIARDIYTSLLSAVEESGASLIGLLGVSGTGKSTIARQVGQAINQRGGIAIWLPAEDIEPGISPTNLLSRLLKRFYPALGPSAGEDAIHLASILGRTFTPKVVPVGIV